MEEGLIFHWGAGGCGVGEGWLLKTMLKNTCERVHLSIKLPAISLQMNFFIHIFHGF